MGLEARLRGLSGSFPKHCVALWRMDISTKSRKLGMLSNLLETILLRNENYKKIVVAILRCAPQYPTKLNADTTLVRVLTPLFEASNAYSS